MPIYEYDCPDCGHRFEKIVRIGASPPPCPACASTGAVKRISHSSFILSGQGWYKDHYGLKGAEKSAEKSTASTDGAPAAVAESKPAAEAAKPEAKATPPAPTPAPAPSK